MSSLVVGGTSGLGLELARRMEAGGEQVIVTGRHDPDVDFAEFREFDLTGGNLAARIGDFVLDLPPVYRLVYAAGFYQEGSLTDLTDAQVDDMLDVCGRGLIFFTKKLLEKHRHLDEVISITSTSQWVPREREPIYNFAKAGAGHFSHALSLDERISKTIVVGVSGMNSPFWEGTNQDTSQMLDPAWAADQVMQLRFSDEPYQFAKILRETVQPQRVEVSHG